MDITLAHIDQKINILTENMNVVLMSLVKVNERLDRVEHRLDILESEMVRMEEKLDKSLAFSRESIVFLGEKVFGDVERRLIALENS